MIHNLLVFYYSYFGNFSDLLKINNNLLFIFLFIITSQKKLSMNILYIIYY